MVKGRTKNKFHFLLEQLAFVEGGKGGQSDQIDPAGVCFRAKKNKKSGEK